jgi:hypothetical protein
MELSEIQSAIGGPTQLPAKPDGDPNATVLNPLGMDRVGAEEAPQNVTAQQGAGSGTGGLTPNAGQVADGSVHVGGNAPDSSGGPPQLPAGSGLVALTPGHDGRPEGGAVLPGEPPGAAKDPRLGADQTGQGINPMLKPARAPRSDGLFGKPSV